MISNNRRTRAAVDLLLALVALGDGLISLKWGPPMQATLAIVAALGLIVRRRWSWVSFVLTLPALTLASTTVAAMIALYTVAVGERRRALIWVAGVTMLVAYTIKYWGITSPSDAIPAVIFAVISSTAPIALGMLVRTRGELADRVRELDRSKASERRRAAAEVLAAERARIAREMHDVVSHQVSLIAVQAGALQVATPDPFARETATTIRSLATHTLDELRHMVSVLRADDGNGTQLAPQPRTSDIDELIAGSGISADVRIDLPADLPNTVQRAVYRTIQEGLTNIRKHAPDAHTTIRANSDATGITVLIHNTAGGTATPGLPTSGHGLIGLRERAELLNGTLNTAIEPNGAFRLELRIPSN